MSPTRVLMSVSAVALALLGILCLFAPDVVLGHLGAPVGGPAILIVQVMGALYLGFAALNWMGRGNVIGGIYGRPVTIANLLHFLSAGLAMIKMVSQAPDLRSLWPVAVLYSVFAVSFAVVLLRHPSPPKTAG